MNEQEVAQIRNQLRARQWPKWLESITVDGLRGWSGQTVDLEFPVTAVVGENGTGKTTVLRAAACAYESNGSGGTTFFPSDFFVDTAWESFRNVSLTYSIRQGNAAEVVVLKKKTERWSYPERGRPKRSVFFFDISRTVPLDASIGYAKIAKKGVTEVSTEEISDEFRNGLSHILGRPYSRARFATTTADAKKNVGLLTREFGEISQFHQGAGEDATLDLVQKLQSIPDHALVIIDEVENSLHPRAQRRWIRFLLTLARRKRLQIIVSTHSPYIFEELPEEARVLLLPGPRGPSVVYGASTEFALSRLDDAVHREIHIFVEDTAAQVLLREILASDPARGADLLQRIAIIPVGPAHVVTMMGKLGQDGRLPYRSLAVLDGDIAAGPGAIALPGTVAPERLVFEQLKAAGWPNLAHRFGMGAGSLFSFLEDAMLDPDHHRWVERVGDRVLKSATSVWEVLANEWARSCLQDGERARIVQAVDDALRR